MASKRKLGSADLAALHLFRLGAAKSGYKISDSALEALIEKSCPRCKSCGARKAGAIITLPARRSIPKELRGRKVRVIDKFADRNSIGVGMNARRFELDDVIEPS